MELDDEYKKRLRQAFAAMLTKARETHAKQLGLAGAAAPPMDLVEVTVYPPFTCEPLARTPRPLTRWVWTWPPPATCTPPSAGA